MTHPPYLKEKARALRAEKGLTIDEIAERLAMSRQTIYHWLRDMPPLERKGRPATPRQVAGARRMRAKYRLRREAAYAQGIAEFADLSRDPITAF